MSQNIYYNSNNFDLILAGPEGQKVVVKRNSKVRLPEYFERYVRSGYLTKSDAPAQPVAEKPKREQQVIFDKAQVTERKRILKERNDRNKKQINNKIDVTLTRRVLGRPNYAGIALEYKSVLQDNYYPISNEIGVGILSYNRPYSLKRCLDSIRAHTDLRRTTIFISDDGSTDEALKSYLAQIAMTNDVVVLNHQKRLGIAGNTNRLLRCLSRFKYKLLLNDDVEVLANNWDTYYFDAMRRTGFHHFCCRTPGVYGAESGDAVKVADVVLNKVTERPHGAVLAFDDLAFTAVGYFDENYGIYGVEHVDWSERVAKSSIQPSGFYDVAGSGKYFIIHADESAVENRTTHLAQAKAHHQTISNNRKYIEPSQKSEVPTISYVVPFRDFERTGAVRTVLNNIRAQRYPNIKIVLVEEDSKMKIKDDTFKPITKLFVPCPHGTPFNKSKAFNAGVDACDTDIIVLHDADMLALRDYTLKIVDNLQGFDACFLGGKVLYASQKSSTVITSTCVANTEVICDKSVEYFEGGSIGIKKSAYWNIGGFNEAFIGYGNEDCDFYARMSGGTKFNENRHVHFLHIWHPRTPGWEACHLKNKKLEGDLKKLDISVRIKKLRDTLTITKYARHL